MLEEFKCIIHQISDELNLSYQTFSNDWIIKLSRDNINKYIVGMKFPLNDQALCDVLNDKYATYTLLKNANIPIIEHNIIFNPITRREYISDISFDKLEEYFNLQINHTVVIKANSGFGGYDVHKCNSYFEMLRTIEEIFKHKDSLSICPFYDIETEYRLIYLDGECKLLYGKKASSTGWKHNLSQGAKVVDDIELEVQSRLNMIAKKILDVLPIVFASIDIVKTVDNQLLVMEINPSVSMLRYFEGNPERKEKAKSIYKDAVLKLFE